MLSVSTSNTSSNSPLAGLLNVAAKAVESATSTDQSKAGAQNNGLDFLKYSYQPIKDSTVIGDTIRNNAANQAYGTGTTGASVGAAYSTVGKVDIKGDNGTVQGQTDLLSAGARTYTTKSKVGAETQASLERFRTALTGALAAAGTATG